jgi:hypothetical protein
MYDLIYNNNEHNPTQRRGDVAFSPRIVQYSVFNFTTSDWNHKFIH